MEKGAQRPERFKQGKKQNQFEKKDEASVIDLTYWSKTMCTETGKIGAYSPCSQTGERPRNFSMALLCQNRLFSSLK